ncbi:unnamed protein product, partial [Closterium sp. NIES-54]
GCLPHLRTSVASAAAAEPTATTEVAVVAAPSSGWGQRKGGRGRGGGGGVSTSGGVVAGNAGAGGATTGGGGGSAAKATTVIAAAAASVLEPCWERYFLIIVDDYSHYTIVFPLERKADMPGVLLTWLVAVRTQRAQLVLCLHSDRGGDFASVQEDMQYEMAFLAVAAPHLYAMLLAPVGDIDALDIPTPRTRAGKFWEPWAFLWTAAMDEEMAAWRSSCTYVDAVSPPGPNVVDVMWIFEPLGPSADTTATTAATAATAATVAVAAAAAACPVLFAPHSACCAAMALLRVLAFDH